MSKALWLKPWHELGGWWWEIEGNSGRLTEYRTNRQYRGLKVRMEDDSGSYWVQVGEHTEWPPDRTEMVVLLAADGHDVSALTGGEQRRLFAFGEKDTGRGDV